MQIKINEIEIILKFIKEKIPDVRRIGITGSYAAGEQTEDSDIDIVVDIESGKRAHFWSVAGEISDIIERNFMITVDYIFFDAVIKKSNINESKNLLEKAEGELYLDMLNKLKWVA